MKKMIINNPFLNDYETIFVLWKYNEVHDFTEKHFWCEVEKYEDSPWILRYQNNSSIICLHSDNKYCDKKTVIHEVTHLIHRLLDYLNIDNSSNNTELIANLMAYYLYEALKFYNFKK
jgi:hypothetical protein